MVELPDKVTPLTVINPAFPPGELTLRVPVEAIEQPAAPFVVEGALQPVGTATVTEPLFMPPVAAVYVRVIVFPVDAAETKPGDGDIVPDPSAASVGWRARVLLVQALAPPAVVVKPSLTLVLFAVAV